MRADLHVISVHYADAGENDDSPRRSRVSTLGFRADCKVSPGSQAALTKTESEESEEDIIKDPDFHDRSHHHGSAAGRRHARGRAEYFAKPTEATADAKAAAQF